MEKFAVDLDKVLDEFEFNEDREEQLLLVSKKGFGNLAPKTNGKNSLHNEAATGATQVFEQIQSAKATAQPMNSVLRTNVFPTLIENNSWDLKGRKANSSNSQDHLEKNTTGNKINVSGVFSSLNDYLNAGNLNVDVKTVAGMNTATTHEKNEHVINETKYDISQSKTFTHPEFNLQKSVESYGYNYFPVGNTSNVKEAIENPNSTLTRDELIRNTVSKTSVCDTHPETEIEAKITALPTQIATNTINEVKDSVKLPGDTKTIDTFQYAGNITNIQVPTKHMNTINELRDSATVSSDTKSNEKNNYYGNITKIQLPINNELNIAGDNNVRPDASVTSHGAGAVNCSISYTGGTVLLDDSKDGEQKCVNKSENNLSEVSKQPISFNDVEDLSDSELDNYLKELEEIYDHEIGSSVPDSETNHSNVLPKSEETNITAHESVPISKIVSSIKNESEKICQNVRDKKQEIEQTPSSCNEYVSRSNSSGVDNVAKDSLEVKAGQNHSEKTDTNLSLISYTAVNQNIDTVTGVETANVVDTSPPPQFADNENRERSSTVQLPDRNLENEKKHTGPETYPKNVDAGINKMTELVSSCYLSDRKGSGGHVNILGTGNVTSSVSSVISIECQQTNRDVEESQVKSHKDVKRDSFSSTVDNLSDLLKKMKLSESPEGFNESTEVKSEENMEFSKDKYSSEVVSGISGEFNKLVGVPHNLSQPDGEQKPQSSLGINEDGEKPARPKYLYLPSKIIVDEEGGDLHGLNKSCPVGVPGETPSKCDGNQVPHVADGQGSVSSGSDSHTSPEISESSPLGLPSSPLPVQQNTMSEAVPTLSPEERNLGKYPPFWVPDADAQNCMLCNMKFSVIKRRHHCRACGKVLCSKCCSLKASLDYMDNAEGRVCHPCFGILARAFISEHTENLGDTPAVPNNESSSAVTGPPLGRQPNPNNPMEYCSTIPPLEQAASAVPQPLPSVMVPVGVLKREGSSRSRSDVTKQVMFSDGIRPGGDLTELDGSSEPRLPYRRQERSSKRIGTPPGTPSNTSNRTLRALLPLDPNTKSYIPSYKGLPPLASLIKGDLKLDEETDVESLIKRLKDENEPPITFALNRNLFVRLKIVNLKCCVNRTCWCFSTIGMSSVSQDEIVIILECLPNEATMPRDIFTHLNTLYQEAARGRMVSELGHSVFQGTTFLGSAEHGGFIYIRPSFQCMENLILPPAPYLVGILIHRWETPWAKVFPIRLMLRLGAEYRYYPCMLASVRGRSPVYCEIGHTIMNLLADFRNLSYTLPSVRGLVIHIEDRHTSVLLPKNRYDQVTRALNNSNDHVLALAANFSYSADSHLVCIQSAGDESYHTEAISISNKPRRVTGASFVVFNGALKASSNLTAKSNIVEDGLMVQITPETIQELRSSLRNMKDFSISCGPTGVAQPDEMVYIKWVEDDKNFNIGVKSLIDGRPLDGIPSIRVHNGTDYMGGFRFIRWTEVFIIQSEETSEPGNDPIDISRLTESIAKATCLALINLLDLLAQAGLTKIAIRAMIHPENVGYEAGSQGEKLPPIYMNSLDNELIPILHKAASMSQDSPAVVLELIFHIMLQ